MKKKKINKPISLSLQAGQVSRLLLVLAIIIFVAAIIVFTVLKATSVPPKPVVDETIGPKVAYEATLGDIKFTFQEARDMGKVLVGVQSRFPDWQKNLTTTEKFIKVQIGAQNKGKENIPERVWNIENIVDSEGRNYVPQDNTADAWLPDPNLCGALLKPEFAATPCVRIYEVSKISTGLKIIVSSFKKENAADFSTDERNKETALIDLIVTQ
ncbi:MAG: hypothetical protein HY005_02035 [Candidatus Staskawiczbacteria bacterium]|nr:hypothetical protein [Candidatus Staskawiczbacteria bacterium]MBI3337384.1 hypothetical protein [Candidatus Staskawiczbacteria bacterium]